MMLLNDLYTLGNWSTPDTASGQLRAVLVLNAVHPIFAGHFPGQPVVPGACQLQIVEELLAHVFETEYRLAVAGQIKFLSPIDPRRNPRIEAVLRYAAQPGESGRPGPPAEMQVTAILSADDAIFLKLNGIFRAE